LSTGIIVTLLKKHYQEKLFSFSLMCILGGAIGNMLDRIFYQYVIDFIHFYMSVYSFPVFNFADIAISVGAIGLVISTFKK
jgi:signal peptidase II